MGLESSLTIYKAAQGGVENLWSQPLSGGKPKQLTEFTSGQIFAFAFSRDGKKLALAPGSITSDVVVITGFRCAR